MKKELKNIKSTGFKTPKGYFDTLEDDIMSSIILDDTLKSKTTGQTIPEGYFDTVENNVFDKLANSQNETKVISLFSRKNMVFVSSVAAVLIIFLLVISPTTPSFDTLEIETVENYISEEDFSHEDIAALLSDEELEDVINSEISFNEDSLEDYILDNTTIEDLLIE